MADRPILFRDDMVRAILDGRKTVTRRVGKTWAKAKPGDVLWVREAWNVGEWSGGEGPRSWFEPVFRIREALLEHEVIYREDGFSALADVPKYRPSIHMPRWACRLTLRVVSVCVEHVDYDFPCNGVPGAPRDPEGEARREGFGSWDEFWAVWQSMHADHIGPVWRVEFERVEQP